MIVVWESVVVRLSMIVCLIVFLMVMIKVVIIVLECSGLSLCKIFNKMVLGMKN